MKMHSYLDTLRIDHNAFESRLRELSVLVELCRRLLFAVQCHYQRHCRLTIVVMRDM